MGAVRLPDILKINSGLIALLVCFMAVGAFWLAEKAEDKYGDPETLPVGSRKIKMASAALLIFLGLVLAILNPDKITAKVPARPAEAAKKVEKMQEVAPQAEEPAVSGFKIVDDEGC